MKDDEALAWLRERCPITTSKIGLAREWGWDDMKVHRRWIQWQNAKLITVTNADDGKRWVLTWIADGEKDEKARKRVTHPSHEPSQPTSELLTPSFSEPSQPVSPPSHSDEKSTKIPQDSSVRSIERGLELLSEKTPPRPSTPKLLTDLMGRVEKVRENPLLRSEKADEKGEKDDEKSLTLPSHTPDNVFQFRRPASDGNLAREIDALKEEIRKDIEGIPERVQPNSLVQPKKPDRGLVARRFFGTLIAAFAATLALGAFRINWTYGASLGEDKVIALIGLAADGVALAMPTAAMILAMLGDRPLARKARLIWFVTILWAVMSTLGFAARNIEHSTAKLDHAATQYAGMKANVERLRRDRAAITETRSVQAIVAAAVSALTEVPRTKVESTARCTDVTIPSSAEACKPVLDQREAEAQARRRDELDTRLADAEAALTAAPAVHNADPLPGAAASLVNWLTSWLARLVFDDWTGIAPNDVVMLRLLVLAVLPHVAGWLFEIAAGLWFRRTN